MEFFRELAVESAVDALQEELTIARLPQQCSEVDKVLSHDGEQGEIYCLWGQFRVHRELIRDGVRFTLPGCPNALAWTVTRGPPPDSGVIVIHCTINRHEQDPDFVESIECFMDAMATGVAGLMSLPLSTVEE